MWEKSEVTQLIFKRLKQERAMMVDSIIYKNVEEPDVVIGRVQAIDQLLSIDFEGVFSE